MNKTGRMGAGTRTFLWLIGIVAVVYFVAQAGFLQTITGGTGGDGTGDGTTVQACGFQPTITYDAEDEFLAGTNPSASLWIYSPEQSTIADGSTSTALTPGKTYKGIAGNNSATYFAKDISFDVKCATETQRVKLANSVAGTFTIFNPTTSSANTASATEAFGASDAKTVTARLTAPVDDCMAYDHGSDILINYDDLYWSAFDPGQGLQSSSQNSFFVSNVTNATFVKSFYLPGRLCDGETKDITFKATASSTNPGNDQNAWVHFTFAPRDLDLNADDLSLITGIYDEDNNYIGGPTTNATLFVS